MSAATNYTESKALTYLLTSTADTRPTAWYVGLFTTATDDAGDGTEVSGNAYVRKAVLLANGSTPGFTISTSGSSPNISTYAKNALDITWPVATGSWGTITHIAIFDALTSGNMLFHGAVTSSKSIANGDTFQILANNLSIELQ